MDWLIANRDHIVLFFLLPFGVILALIITGFYFSSTKMSQNISSKDNLFVHDIDEGKI